MEEYGAEISELESVEEQIRDLSFDLENIQTCNLQLYGEIAGLDSALSSSEQTLATFSQDEKEHFTKQKYVYLTLRNMLLKSGPFVASSISGGGKLKGVDLDLDKLCPDICFENPFGFFLQHFLDEMLSETSVLHFPDFISLIIITDNTQGGASSSILAHCSERFEISRDRPDTFSFSTNSRQVEVREFQVSSIEKNYCLIVKSAK